MNVKRGFSPLEGHPPARLRGDRALERDCQTTVVTAARMLGYRVLSIRPAFSKGKYSTPIQGDPGYPDLTLVHPKVGVLFVELKRHPNRLEPDQEIWAGVMLDAGLTWRLVWVPEHLDSFIDELAQLTRTARR